MPVTTSNIVVVYVNYHFGPYAESTGGSGDFESQTLGRGVGYVLRDGHSIKVTWHRQYLISPFSFYPRQTTRSFASAPRSDLGRNRAASGHRLRSGAEADVDIANS